MKVTIRVEVTPDYGEAETCEICQLERDIIERIVSEMAMVDGLFCRRRRESGGYRLYTATTNEVPPCVPCASLHRGAR
ncbi:hypothetical protein ACFSHT_33005 [Paraburkholderia silviterrae]|uniref:Uncharacterized protein n=1 Tax=Paraburkholderia silviterrae TaxID=2528715 RepID=A0A4R5M3T6_9BURK|nr:hypothetical protein [Paraburkholderia silviterrae]TDG19901.1 hypothetical protein EYW47_29060 [Paraburkholderia silviterrae]